MITKIGGTQNGYLLSDDSSTQDLRAIAQKYPHVRCIITNANTRKRFGKSLMESNIHTINNHVGDDQFYINQIK